MTTKHYDINYLQNSRRLLISIKEQSYIFFESLTSGTIIDLGCGAGKDVIELTKIAGENLKIIGVDHDPVMIQVGKNESGGMGNIDFILSDAYNLPFENETIAGLRTERLIQHLKDPEKVIAEVGRILKKDAPFVIIETDWHSLSFYTEFIDVQKKLNMYLTEAKINNGFAAQNLVSYLQFVGFRDIKFQIHPFLVNTLQEANEYFWIEKMIKEASDQGYLAIDESKAFYGVLQKADNGHYFACSINLVLVSCIK